MEIQAITKILNEKTLNPLLHAGISSDYFVVYSSEAQFIYEHYEKNGVVCTKETFLKQFTAFNLTLDTEPWNYIVEQLIEGYLFSNLSTIITDSVPKIQENSFAGAAYLNTQLQTVLNLQPLEGVDLVKDAEKRLLEYTKNTSENNSAFMPTGLPDMDEDLVGWHKGEELTVIMARTNEGKTWLLLKYLVEQWKLGKRVGLYSGEMGENVVGYRFDSLLENISNMSLVKGDTSVQGEYEQYINELQGHDNPFIIITKKDIGSEVKVSDMEMFIEKYNLDILGIDQLYHLDERKHTNNPLRLKKDEISGDLYDLSSKRNIPILVTDQASRGAAGDKNKTPMLEHLAESDNVARNASRVITMRNEEGYMYISIRKNRYGKKDITYQYYWNIDLGVFEFVNKVEEGSLGEASGDVPQVVQTTKKASEQKTQQRRKYDGKF